MDIELTQTSLRIVHVFFDMLVVHGFLAEILLFFIATAFVGEDKMNILVIHCLINRVINIMQPVQLNRNQIYVKVITNVYIVIFL